MKLTENFTLSELYKSQTAIRLGINNEPKDVEIIENMRQLCINVLQPIRNYYGVPFVPSSCYRSQALNNSIGGVSTSQHSRGQAADIEIPGVSNYDLACFIRDNINFDQLILEFYVEGKPDSGWVHVSYTNKKQLRREVKTKSAGKPYKQGLIK